MMSVLREPSEDITKALKTIYDADYVDAGDVYEGFDYDHGRWLHGWWFKPRGEPAVYFGSSEEEVLETVAFIQGLS